METATTTNSVESPISPAAQPLKRRGLIAAAAALAASVAVSNTTSAYNGFRIIATGYSSVLDERNDAIQGYTSGGDNSGVFGRNDSPNGIGVTGVGTNGAGVYGQSTTSASSGVFGRSDSGQGVYGKSNAGYGVYGKSESIGVVGESSGTGSGVYGYSTASGVYGFSSGSTEVNGYSSVSTGVLGNSPEHDGVGGVSTRGPGVRGSSQVYFGVIGETQSTPGLGVAGVYGTGTGIGVYGQSATSQGVLGSSGMSTGVHGTSSGGYGVWGASSGSHGMVATTSAANFSALYCYRTGTSANAATFSGPVIVSDAGASHAVLASAQQAGVAGICGIGVPGGYAGYFAGDVLVSGNLVVGGSGAKSAAVPHPDGSTRLLYCVESPESWFEDYGDGTLAGGTATITLDPDFAAVADTRTYRVFVSAYGDSKGLYVAARTPTGFTVREQGGGTSNTAFSWRVVAKRKDIEGKRLAKTDIARPMAVANERSMARAAVPAPAAPPMVPVPVLPKPPVVEPPIMPRSLDDGPAQPPAPGVAAANAPTTNVVPTLAPPRR